ncbi:MAG TPA: hypothetical protein VLR45_04310, partial [Desulfoprunum sp.]|nr:hypothetical protein [Desulfoprunum sp.]
KIASREVVKHRHGRPPIKAIDAGQQPGLPSIAVCLQFSSVLSSSFWRGCQPVSSRIYTVAK